MENLVRVVFGLLLIALVFASVYAADTPEMIWYKQINLTEELASVIHDNQNDCDRMGSKLGQLVIDNAALMMKAQRLTPEQKRQGKQRYDIRRRAASARMVDGLSRCHTNARVEAAIAKIHALEPGAADALTALATRSQ